MNPNPAAVRRGALRSYNAATGAVRGLAAAAVLAAVSANASAQDPLRGRDIYLNAAAIKGVPMRSCVQCHSLPPDTKLKGASVAQLFGAFASVDAMSGFVTAFNVVDVTDLSAFLADPAATPTPLPAIDPLVLRLAAPLAASSPAVVVALRNDGAAPLRLAADPISISGTDGDAFSVSASTCAPQAFLLPGTSCQFELRYAPQQTLASLAQLIVRYDTIAQPTSILIAGLPQPRARFTHSVAALAFAVQPIGTPAPAQSVRVLNAGTAPLAVAERRLDGTAAADFMVQGCTAGAVLAPGASCRLDVEFNPSAAGARSATLTLASPDAVEPMTVTLSGAGLAAVGTPPPTPVPPPSPTPPPAAPPTNAGGGGAMPPLGLLALLVAGALRWRNRSRLSIAG